MKTLIRRARSSWASDGAKRCSRPSQVVRRLNYHPPGYDSNGKLNQPNDKPPSSLPTEKPIPSPLPPPGPAGYQQLGVGQGHRLGDAEATAKSPKGKWGSGRDGRAEGELGAGERASSEHGGDGDGGAPVVYGALGQEEEQPVYDLPKEWKTLVSTLCLRTNFEPAELADLFQRFRQLAGTKEYLTAAEFRRTVRRNFGIMNEEWVKKYFKAFDRNHSGTIDFQEYVMGFAGMARVLTDKKAHSLIGLSTGSNIVRSGRSARLFWDGPPRRVAVIKKWKDPDVAAKTGENTPRNVPLKKLIRWLQSQDLMVLVDPSEDHELGPDGRELGPRFMPDVKRFDPTSLATETDFIVCLGGDGTVLKAAQYFDDSTPIPPTLAFGLGSLGFLAPFSPSECQAMITRVLEAYRRPISVTLRTRLRGEVYSRDGHLEKEFYSLNEFIVNRGISGVLSTLEVYVDGQLVTTAQGDGLIVASPSGSTAYNISAGGCMVSPLVPATLITPIAPHSLSFRPILTSASSEITVRIPDTARADGWMSYDATEAVTMKKGTYVKLSTAAIPLPTVNQYELDGDWFQSIRDKLNWNLRTLQTPYHGDEGDQALDLDSENGPGDHPRSPAPPPFHPHFPSMRRGSDRNRTTNGDSPRGGSPI